MSLQSHHRPNQIHYSMFDSCHHDTINHTNTNKKSSHNNNTSYKSHFDSSTPIALPNAIPIRKLSINSPFSIKNSYNKNSYNRNSLKKNQSYSKINISNSNNNCNNKKSFESSSSSFKSSSININSIKNSYKSQSYISSSSSFKSLNLSRQLSRQSRQSSIDSFNSSSSIDDDHDHPLSMDDDYSNYTHVQSQKKSNNMNHDNLNDIPVYDYLNSYYLDGTLNTIDFDNDKQNNNYDDDNNDDDNNDDVDDESMIDSFESSLNSIKSYSTQLSLQSPLQSHQTPPPPPSISSSPLSIPSSYTPSSSISYTPSSSLSYSPINISKKSISNSHVSHINTSPNTSISLSDNKSCELLIKLLNNDKPTPIPIPKNNNIIQDTTKKGEIISNLTNSINYFKDVILIKNYDSTKFKTKFNYKIFDYSFIISPRMTDDKLPKISTTPSTSTIDDIDSDSDSDSECDEDNLTELQTISSSPSPCPINSCSDLIKLTSKKSFKNRDERINSNFLRLYAIDYNSRMSKILPNTYTIDEFQSIITNSNSIGVKLFHERFNFYKISNINKDKLWKSVILPPRSDGFPTDCINLSQYIFVGDSPATTPTPATNLKLKLNSNSNSNDNSRDNGEVGYSSLIRLNGNYQPWNNSIKSIKPTGILPNIKFINNGKSPNSGVSKTQFTVKGWCNSRWIDISKDD